MGKRLSLEVARGRPVRDLSGITVDIDSSLRELGIRTVAELASANVDTLAIKGAGIKRETAMSLIADAKNRLKLE